jgi:hypothetical protein
MLEFNGTATDIAIREAGLFFEFPRQFRPKRRAHAGQLMDREILDVARGNHSGAGP